METVLTVEPRIPRYIRGIGVLIKINTAVVRDVVNSDNNTAVMVV